jgi:hypothetical protein
LVLVHFFGNLSWDSPLETGVEEQHLSPEDQLFILAQAALYLTTTRGMGGSEARMCYERVESLCHSVDNPRLRYSAMIGKWRYSLTNEKLTEAMQIAKGVYLMAQQQKDPALLTGAYNALACTAYSQGTFRSGAAVFNAWRAELALRRDDESDPAPKSERFGRMRIQTASLLTSCGRALPLNSPQANDKLRRRTLASAIKRRQPKGFDDSELLVLIRKVAEPWQEGSRR